MSDPSWRRLEVLFAEAAALPPPEHGAFARRACAGDDDLRARLLRLLAAEARGGGFLERAIHGGAIAVSRELDEANLGRRIGPYRLTRILGRGGTSVVYMAERDDAQYRATVAVKLLHPGLGSAAMLERLREERQILAQLSHPNLARLLDGGTTGDGEPYFVMEYVDGVALLEFAESRSLSLDARLGLFLSVCGAVSHAHQNLVIHCDLKPGNVLVTAEGVPKLLDFGIARLLGPRSAGGDPPGSPAGPAAMLTPAYASPEQIRGRPLTTAADIYSLGVLLYELLTTRRPYGLDAAVGAREAGDRILLTDPSPPSLAGGLPLRLAARLRGDLDAIVLRAMHKDPAQRYTSAADLASDVERHRRGYPVAARPARLGHRAGRFLRRHRVGAALTAAALLLVAASLVAVAAQARRARQEGDRAQRIAAMLVEMFEVAESAGDLTVRQLLDHGAERLGPLEGQPETQAMLMGTLAGLYELRGHLPEAAGLYERLVALHRRRGAGDAVVAGAVYDLARALSRQGEYGRAAELFGEALELRRRALGRDDPAVAASLNALALALHEVGRIAEAERLYREALDLDLRIYGPAHGHTTKVRANLALLLHDTGRSDEAESIYRSLLAALESRRGSEEDNERAEVLDGLGLALTAQGKHAEAVRSLEEGARIRRRLYGEEHFLVARSEAHLGLALVRRGALEAAEPLLDRSLEQRRRLLGERHMEFGDSLHAAGSLRASQDRTAEAAVLFARAAETYRVALGASHPLVAEALLALGRARLALEERAGGCAALREAAALLPEGDHRLPEARRALADCP